MTPLNTAALSAAHILANLEAGDSLTSPGARAVLPSLPPGVPAGQMRIGARDVSWACQAGVLTLRLSDGAGLVVEAALSHRRAQALFHVLTLSQVRLVTPGFQTRTLGDLLTTVLTFSVYGEANSPCSVQLRQGDPGWVWLRSVLNHAAHRFEIWQSKRPDFLDPCRSSGHVAAGFLEAADLHEVFVRTQHGLPVDDETEETALPWDTRAGAGPLGAGRPRSLSVGDQVVTPTGERFWVMDEGFQKV